MRQKRLVTLFYFNDNIAGKDMFLVPKYLSEALGMECEFVFPKWKENEHLRGEYRGVKLTAIKSKSRFHSTFWTEKAMLWWLICHARRIDVLSLFWLSPRNLAFAKIYKCLNHKGTCYIKGDISSAAPIQSSIKRKVWDLLISAVDLLSVETEDIYDKIINGVLGEYLKDHTVLMSNGFDIEMFEQLGIERKGYNEKEKLILTVGRIGSSEKNNEMLLSALDGLNMGDWSCWFVGPVEGEFKTLFEQFIKNNPDKQAKVQLLGGIYDKRKLWEVYNRSSIFVLTSPKECMAQVFSEALAFGNYIITTNVQGAIEITDRERLGKIIGLNDTQALRASILEVIEGRKDISKIPIEAIKLSNIKYNWLSLTKIVAERLKRLINEKSN